MTIDDLSINCNSCSVHDIIFRNDPVKNFVNFIIREKSFFDDIICMAHNASGFDAHFILKELVEERKAILPSVILNGRNIILLQYGRTRFIDSLNYFHMKLSALPKTFDLPPNLKNGYFPHLFNTLQNENYIGPMPAADFYAPDSMTVADIEIISGGTTNAILNTYSTVRRRL